MIVAAAGCNAELGAEARLQQVEVPAGFDFASTRGVALRVVSLDARALTVATPDGAVLYRGPAPRGELPLRVPSKDRQLDITVTTPDGLSHHSVAIERGHADL